MKKSTKAKKTTTKPAKSAKAAASKASRPAKDLSLRSLDHIGEVVRALRKACELKQEDLADMTGVHAITVSRLETGAIKCGPDSLYKLAEGLKLRPSSLVFMAEEFAKTKGKALQNPATMTVRFETIEGSGSWKSFMRRMQAGRGSAR